MWKKGAVGVILLFSVTICSFFLFDDCKAETTMPRCAVIIVSDLNGYDQDELEKADQFYRYLLDENYTDDDIQYLTASSMLGQDAEPTVSNINSAFSWLENTSRLSSQPVIYISDHVILSDGEETFQFSNGNITTDDINNQLDDTEFEYLTMIINGNNSALSGPSLSGASREIICSMDVGQYCSDDQFNITRGLNDPFADLDLDGEVSYHEAYQRECYNLRSEDQDPKYYVM